MKKYLVKVNYTEGSSEFICNSKKEGIDYFDSFFK
jgi:hypothetical protein